MVCLSTDRHPELRGFRHQNGHFSFFLLKKPEADIDEVRGPDILTCLALPHRKKKRTFIARVRVSMPLLPYVRFRTEGAGDWRHITYCRQQVLGRRVDGVTFLH